MHTQLMILLLSLYSFIAVAGEQLADQPDDTEPPVVTEPEVERPALRSRHLLQLERLQQSVPEQFRPLASEYDAAGALYLPANQSSAKGWVILLPGTGQSADASFNIDALRRFLPDSGWHTLSLQVPEPPFAGLHVSPPPDPASLNDNQESNSEEAGSNEDAATGTEPPAPVTASTTLPTEPDKNDDEQLEPADTETTDVTPALPAYGERMLALLDAAVEMARAERPAQLILLGQQEGAYWVTLWSVEQAAPADALILLHARQPDTADRPLPDLVSQISRPVADVFTVQNSAEAITARQRLNSSSRSADQQYQQVALREPAQPLRESEVIRRIKGWLSRR